MTRRMADSVDANHLPAGCDMYAGYINGTYANVDKVRARFPGKPVVTISVNTSGDADVLDVERGDAEPWQAPAWAIRQRNRGGTPCIYMPASLWSQVRQAFQNSGTPEPLYWVAQYDNNQVLPVGAVAKQYGGDLPGNYDMSIVADNWPGVDPPPHKETLMRVPNKDHSAPVVATTQGTVVRIPGLVGDADLDWENFRAVTSTTSAHVWAGPQILGGGGAALVYAAVPTEVVVEYV